MAVVVNERDVLMQSAPSRVVDVTLPSNVILPSLKGITLRAPALIFRVDNAGSPSPSAITMTASLQGVPSDSALTWSVTTGTAALTGAGAARTISYATMTSDTVSVAVSVTVEGLTYTDTLTFIKIRDGSVGTIGARGSLTVARPITGSTWSDLEAGAAIAAVVSGGPVSMDTCTLFNASVNFAEIRRYNGTTWEPVPSSMPGSVLMKQSIATEHLLVTGMGIALNSDPNTVDISAWTGAGISIVQDTTAPNGASALRCAGLGTTVLSRRFAIDPTSNYRVRTWVKQESGDSTAFLLVAFFDAAGTLIVGTANPSGWTSPGTYHYYGLVNEHPGPTWTEESVSFGADEVFTIPAAARFAAVGLISNFSGTGVQRISGLICHLKTTGSMVVDGSIAARHIDARGLTIRGPSGNVVLDAGSNVAPASLQSPINLLVPDAIYIGDSETGLSLGTNGLRYLKDGSIVFELDEEGNAVYAGDLSGAKGTFSGSLTAQAISAVDTINLAGESVTTAAYASDNGFRRWFNGSVSGTWADAFSSLAFNARAGDLLLVEATWRLDKTMASASFSHNSHIAFNGVAVQVSHSESLASFSGLITYVLRAAVIVGTTGLQTLELFGTVSGANFSGYTEYAFRGITLSAFIRRR